MVAALVLGSRATLAAEVSEVEPNQPLGSAQLISISGGSVTIKAVLGQIGSSVDDTDYFSFYGTAGDFVVVDIDGAAGGVQSFDSVIALFAPGGGIVAQNDDAALDEGSISTTDSRIEKLLSVSGIYTVGVTGFPRGFVDGGGITAGAFNGGGDYTLIISGVTDHSFAQEVAIEVRPGDRKIVKLNPNSGEKVSVAIFSSDEFDARDIDNTSLTFGAAGDEPSLAKCHDKYKDVNRDGRADMVCKFYINKTGLSVGDDNAVLKGKTKVGTPIEGKGWLKVKVEKRNSYSKDDDDDHRGKGKGKGRD
jgi:hypothetical protein